MSLKIVTHNVRGLGDKMKRKRLFNLFRQKKVDIVLLQETHSTPKFKNIWRNDWGGNIIYSHGEGNARGAAILFDKNLDYKVCKTEMDQDGRYVICKVKVEDKIMLICNCYAPNTDEPAFFENIINKIMQYDDIDYYIWGGDFNTWLTERDTTGSFRTSCSSELINTFLEENSWTDVWRHLNPEATQYTWLRRKPITGSRIDLILTQEGSIDFVNECEIWPAYLSDHSPVCIEIKLVKTMRGKGYWKLNNVHLESLEYVEEVNSMIADIKQNANNIDPMKKWDVLKNNVVNFSQNYAKEQAMKKRNSVKELHRKLEMQNKKLAMINLSSRQAIAWIEKINVKMDKIKSEIEKIERVKIQGQIIRTKARWTELAEKNSKYFYGLEKSKGKAKCMSALEIDGKIEKDPDVILKQQELFYKKLYTADESVFFRATNNTTQKLNDTHKILLDSDLNVDELVNANKELPRHKSPGPDGLTADWYKIFIHHIKEILLDALLQAKKEGVLHTSARFGIISLIPKGQKLRTQLKNWRPISLLNVDFKIFSKTLANRMKMVISDVIHSDQVEFVAGRSVSENLRTIFDVMELTWRRKIPALLIAVDFEKAFDRVSYPALYAILRFFNFGENFITWSKLLFTDFNLCTTNNGYFSSYWSPTRGLFQGNPAAPLYFLLVAEILSISLRNNPRIKGIDVKNLRLLLSQFADDLNIFMKFDQDSWQATMNEFDKFEKMTGMKISYEKTTIYRIGSIRNTNAKFFSARRVQWSNEPLHILGIWFDHDEDKVKELNVKPITEKVKNVLEVWKLRGLSLMGKIQIVNTLIASLFVYKNAVLPKMCDTLVNGLKKIITEFVWNGKKAKIAWNTLTALKSDGGLGLADIACRDTAQKANWVFKLVKNKAIRTISEEIINHGMGTDFWECNLVSKDVDILFPKVGSFWRDVMTSWFGLTRPMPDSKSDILNQSLWYNTILKREGKPYFNKKLYEAGMKKISDMTNRNGTFISFEHFSEKFGSKDFVTFQGIKKSIPQEWIKKIKQDLETETTANNVQKWKGLKNTAQIIYRKLKNDPNVNMSYVRRWEKLLEHKVLLEDVNRYIRNIYSMTISTKLRSFQYRLLHHAIITNVQLERYGIKDSPLCTYCNEELETVKHLFCECKKIEPLWNSVVKMIKKENSLSTDEILFNNVNPNPKRVENTIVLITKQYIYRTKCLNENLSEIALKRVIGEYKEIEKCIARRKNVINTHNNKWENITCETM